jgi:hypothetical protein
VADGELAYLTPEAMALAEFSAVAESLGESPSKEASTT